MASRRSAPISLPSHRVPRAISWRTKLGLIALVLSGEASSLYLTYAHDRIHRDVGWASACNVGPVVNCDVALTSGYAVAMGIPLSLWGAWFYALLIAALIPALSTRPRLFRWFPAQAFFGATTIGVGVSISLAILSVFFLRSICILCLYLYLVNVLLMVVSSSAGSQSGQLAIGGWRTVWRNGFLRALTATGLVLLLSMRFLYARYSPGGSEVCRTLAETQRLARGQMLTIEVYSDFQCPSCRKLELQLQALIGRRGVQLVQEHFPLESSCNPDVVTTRHPGACMQARAAICADAFDVGFEMRQRLFAEATSSLPRIVELASALGMDGETFEACVMADTVFDRLKSSIARGHAIGVTATPTLIINGRKHVGALSPTGLECLVKASDSR